MCPLMWINVALVVWCSHLRSQISFTAKIERILLVEVCCAILAGLVWLALKISLFTPFLYVNISFLNLWWSVDEGCHKADDDAANNQIPRDCRVLKPVVCPQNYGQRVIILCAGKVGRTMLEVAVHSTAWPLSWESGHEGALWGHLRRRNSTQSAHKWAGFH